MAKKEIAKKETTEIVSYNQIEGLEGIEQDMLIVPRLKLVQKSSEEIIEFEFKAGTFCNSVTKEQIGTVPEKGVKDGAEVIVIPVKVAARSRILFKDFSDGGGIECISQDGRTGKGTPGGNCFGCSCKDWNGDEPPKCTDFINVFCMVEGYDIPIPLVLNFGKTSMKAGKSLVNLLVMGNQSPWNLKFKLSSTFVTNPSGDYFEMRIKPAGKSSEDQQVAGKGFYDMLNSLEYKIDPDIQENAEKPTKAVEADDYVEGEEEDAF